MTEVSQPQDLASQIAMLSDDEVMDLVRKQIEPILQSDIDEDFDPDRIALLLAARKGNLYWRGDHYHALTIQNNQLQFTKVGTPTAASLNDEEDDLFDTVINNYRGLGRKLVAVIGSQPPSVKAVSDNPEDQQSEDNAELANIAVRVLRSWWPVESLSNRVVMGLWKSNTMFGHVRYVADADRWGSKSIPKYELQPQEIEPGVVVPAPVEVGSDEVPNGRVEMSVYDVLSVTVPTYATKIGVDCDWLRLEKEIPRGKLIQAYPKHRKLIVKMDAAGNSTTPGQETGFVARMERDSPAGSTVPHKNLLTFRQYWLLPSVLETIEDEEIREALRLKYPTGLRITKIGTEIIEFREERLSDVWSDCQPDVSDNIHADPIGKDYIPIQDFENDTANIGKETLTRQLPQSIGDPQMIDFERMSQRSFRPNEVIPAKRGMGNLKDAIVNLPKAEFSEQMMPFRAQIHSEGQTITGVIPSIYGGEGPSQTAHEAEMKKNQALQQLGLVWTSLRQFWANIYTLGVKQLAKYGTQVEIAPGDKKTGEQSDPLDVMMLAIDGWHCESSEAFPMTYAQRRDQVQMTIQAGPEAMALMGFDHPLNKPMLHETLGFQGLHIPGKDLVDYVFERIRELLRSGPIEQLDPITGTAQMTPTLQPDQFIEADGQSIVEIIRSWCMTPAGRRAAKKNPEGFANVKAYGQLLEQMAADQAALAAQAQAGPGAGAGGEGSTGPGAAAGNPGNSAPPDGGNGGGAVPSSITPPSLPGGGG